MRASRRHALLLATAFAVLVIAPVSEALHRQTPSLLQITTTASQDVGGAKFVGGSNQVLFHSDGNLLGNGNATPNIFIFDLKLRSKNHLDGIFQLTFGTLPSRRPTGARHGQTVAFESQADLLQNGSTGLQIFAAQHVAAHKGHVPLFQVTKAAGSSFDAHLTENGRYLAFASDVDLRAEGLSPGVHLYRADIKKAHLGDAECPAYPCASNSGLELLTPAVAQHPSIDKVGSMIAFDSTDNVLGPGTSNGFAQVYVRDFRIDITRRLTNALADSRNPVMARNGTTVVFESAADLVGNLNSRVNLFEANLKHEPPVIRQLTFGTDGDSTAATVNGKGDHVIFSSTATLAPGANGVDQLYLLDFDSNQLTRLTGGADPIDQSSAELTFFVFTSTSDVIGNGNTQPQLFLGNTYKLLDPTLPTPTAAATPTATVTP